MKKLALAQVLLLMIGCSSGVIVHDQARATELVVDFLTSLKSAPGMELAYAWTDDGYKQDVSFTDFSRIVASIRSRNQGAEIRLVGFEVFGQKEAIVVYGDSEPSDGKMYFKFSLVGSKTSDYYLGKLSTSDAEFSKNGIYREYGQPIVVEGI